MCSMTERRPEVSAPDALIQVRLWPENHNAAAGCSAMYPSRSADSSILPTVLACAGLEGDGGGTGHYLNSQIEVAGGVLDVVKAYRDQFEQVLNLTQSRAHLGNVLTVVRGHS